MGRAPRKPKPQIMQTADLDQLLKQMAAQRGGGIPPVRGGNVPPLPARPVPHALPPVPAPRAGNQFPPIPPVAGGPVPGAGGPVPGAARQGPQVQALLIKIKLLEAQIAQAKAARAAAGAANPPAPPPVIPAKGGKYAERQGQWLWNALAQAHKEVPIVNGDRRMPHMRGNYLEAILNDPNLVDQMQLALEQRGYGAAMPFGRDKDGLIFPAGQEKVAFNAGGVTGKDGMVIKLGMPWAGPGAQPGYVHPEIWGTKGAMVEEVFRGRDKANALGRDAVVYTQPKIWTANQHPVFSKGGVKDVIAQGNANVLIKAIQKQGYHWSDAHRGNIGWLVDPNRYLPVVLDGGVVKRGAPDPNFQPPMFRDPNYSWLIAALAAGGGLAAGQALAGEPAAGGDGKAEDAGFTKNEDGTISAPAGMQPQDATAPSPYEQRMIPVRGEGLQQKFPITQYREAVDQELDLPTVTPTTMKSVTGRDYEGNVTPRDLIKAMAMQSTFSSLQNGEFVNPMQLEAAMIDSIKGIKPTPEMEKYAPAAHKQFLAVLRSQAPGGENSDKSGIPQEEFSRLESQYGMNANFMYPDRLQPNFDALRQAEFFSAMTDEYKPSQIPSRVLTGVASVIPNFPGKYGDNKPWSEQDDTRKSFGDIAAGTQGGRASDAMRWREYAKPDTDGDGYQTFRDPNTNDSKYQQFSTLTLDGLTGALGQDASRVWSRMRNYTMPLAAERDLNYDQRESLRQVRNAGMRPVPIIPQGMSPEDMDRITQRVKGYEEKSDSAREAWAAQYLGGYPSTFAGGVMNLDRYLTEPDVLIDYLTGGTTTAAKQLAKAGGKTALRNTLIPAARAGAKAVGFQAAQEGTTENPLFESVTNLAVGNKPSEIFFGSQRNAMMGDMDPMTPGYSDAYQQKYKEMGEEVKDVLGEWQTKTGQPKSKPWLPTTQGSFIPPMIMR